MKNQCVLQEWVMSLSLMQQSVLLTVIRGPDGVEKYHVAKDLLRWYRRCILLSAFEGEVLQTPYDQRGGSFTGPSYRRKDTSHPSYQWEDDMNSIVGKYIQSLDGLPHHFQMHFLHASEIVGYKHPDVRIKTWWKGVYERLVNDLHLHPESEEEMDKRLGDRRSAWLERSDIATQK